MHIWTQEWCHSSSPHFNLNISTKEYNLQIKKRWLSRALKNKGLCHKCLVLRRAPEHFSLKNYTNSNRLHLYYYFHPNEISVLAKIICIKNHQGTIWKESSGNKCRVNLESFIKMTCRYWLEEILTLWYIKLLILFQISQHTTLL